MALKQVWVFSLPFTSHGNRMKPASETRVGGVVTYLDHWTTNLWDRRVWRISRQTECCDSVTAVTSVPTGLHEYRQSWPSASETYCRRLPVCSVFSSFTEDLGPFKEMQYDEKLTNQRTIPSFGPALADDTLYYCLILFLSLLWSFVSIMQLVFKPHEVWRQKERLFHRQWVLLEDENKDN